VGLEPGQEDEPREPATSNVGANWKTVKWKFYTC
jgi:hypothetical protein